MHVVEIGKLKLSLVIDGSLNRIAGVVREGAQVSVQYLGLKWLGQAVVCARHTVIIFFSSGKPLWRFFRNSC